MNAVTSPVSQDDNDSHVVHCTSAQGLTAIRKPSVDLAIWPRDVEDAVHNAVDAMTSAGLPHERFMVSASDADRATRSLLHRVISATIPDRGLFIDDVCALIALFRQVTGSKCHEIRLETVTDDLCRKFHADAGKIRLISTYLGPGTEWRPADAACGDAAATRSLSSFHVGLFKGNDAGRRSPTIVHRSPPLANSGIVRLVLAIDNVPA